MKAKLFLLVGLVSIGLLSYSSSPPENENDVEKYNLLQKVIFEGLRRSHFNPKEIDDDFSKVAFDAFIDRMDASKRFFTSSDVKDFKKYYTKVDDQVNAGSIDFFTLVMERFEIRKQEAESAYMAILDNGFNMDLSEDFERDYDKIEFVGTSKELENRWRKSLKYAVLNNYYSSLKKQEKLNTDAEVKEYTEKEEELIAKSKDELIADAIEKVKKTQKNYYTNLNEEKESDFFSIYVNALLSAYDPHTTYYPPKDKANFDINISGQLEGIGARLQRAEGETKVSEVIVGGPAYKGGELEAEDIILSVAQGDEEAVDITNMRLDDAVQLIRGKKGSEARLTVRKVDGTTATVSITRDVVQLEESYAKSAIIEHDDMSSKVGYIDLPSFYSNFNDKNGRRCATDIAAELQKLKQESVGGLILDLRNNSGGSLSDVVEMSGLFIDDGPIVQVKGREGKPYLYEDHDPGVEFDKPFVILVNTFSASASEIIAAAMQDYGRAIIIGSNSTFGKGTVQRFLDLDKMVRSDFNSLKPLGSLKLTTQKFYRINGGATQLKGVEPDIVLPDNYAFMEIGERERENAMPWTEIEALDYPQWTDLGNTKDKVLGNSEGRIKENGTFSMIEKNAKRLKRQQDKTTHPLNLQAYVSERKLVETEAKKFDNLQKELEALKVSTLNADLADIQSDSIKIEKRDKWFEKLQKDVYVLEAINVINDISVY